MSNKNNNNIVFKGKKLSIKGQCLRKGSQAPNLHLVDGNLEDVTWHNFDKQWVILSVVPSLDTSTCAAQSEQLNSLAGTLDPSVSVLTVSLDLPFAQTRWCKEKNCLSIKTASDYKYRTFGEDYGVYIEEMGLLARAIFLVDPTRRVTYLEYVQDLSSEPNYEALVEALASESLCLKDFVRMQCAAN